MSWILSLWGAVPAAVYLVVAILLVRDDRKHNTGHFISLSGLLTMLLVLPVSLPMELSGRKLDYRNNGQVGAALLLTAVLVHLLGAGIAGLVRGMV